MPLFTVLGPPTSLIASAAITASQAGLGAGPTILTGLSVSVTVPAGRQLKIRAHAGTMQMSDGTSGFTADFYVDGVIAGRSWTSDNFAGRTTMDGTLLTVLSAGPHTIDVRTARFLGTGTLTVGAAAANPGFIWVEDVTGAVWPAGSNVTTGLIASEPWTNYVPTLTNITLGSGVLTAAYVKIGRTVHFRFKFILGAGSAIGTTPAFTLPVPANAAYADGIDIIPGTAHFGDTGTADYFGILRKATGDNVLFVVGGAAGTFVNDATLTATVPFTWTNNDRLVAAGTYESAA